MTTWLPLESNPEVMTKYIYKMGVSEKWKLVDILGLDPAALEWVPKPVKAVILLAPCSDAYEAFCAEEKAKLEANPPEYPKDLFYMKQVIRNACGAIALVHGIANNRDIEISDGILKKYFDATKDLTPEERGKILEADAEFSGAHQEIATEGQTAADPDMPVNHHFATFIHQDGDLYELDGRKSFPIKHGPTTPATLLEDAAKICRDYMGRDPNEIRFTVIALTANQD